MGKDTRQMVICWRGQGKQQILMWIEKKTKTNNSEILTKEIKRMPFIILSPQGEVINIDPLQ